MRLDTVLDSLYLLGSLGLPASPVCRVGPPTQPSAARETASAPVSAKVTAFIDVNVVPMDAERVLARQTVLVEGGRITALGPVSRVKVPAGAERIDGRGKYLMPGLTDMHAHLHFYGFEKKETPEAQVQSNQFAERYMFSYLANGVTAVRHLNTVSEDPQIYLRFNQGNVLAPRLYLAPLIRDLYPVRRENGQLKKVAPRLDSIAAYLTTAKAAGYDFIDIAEHYYNDLKPGEPTTVLDSVLAIAHRMRMPLASHTNGESYEQLLKFGTYGAAVDHLYAFRDTLGGPEAAVSAAEIQAVVAEVKRAGTWIDVTLDCVAERRKPPVIEVSRRLVKAMQDAGIGMLLGGDADGAHGTATSGVHEELAEMIRAGLTPYQALVTGTRNVAQYFGIQDSSGTVAVGKRADLVLLYHNPLANARHALEPAGVMIRGQWVDRTTLDQGLLAVPTEWFKLHVDGALPPSSGKVTGAHFQRLRSLFASLDTTAPATGRVSADSIVSQIAAEFSALRPVLLPERREVLDPMIRAWLREQIRTGHRVSVEGLPPTT